LLNPDTVIQPGALESLIDSYWAEPEGLPMAARWGRAFAQAYPESTRAWRDYCRTLIELQALDEVARELDTAENLPALESGVGLLFRLGIVVRLHRSRGDLQTAARDAERFEHAFRQAFAGRSEATGPGGPVAAVLDVTALDHIGRGEAARALEHYQRLFPNSESLGWGIDATEGLNGDAPVSRPRWVIPRLSASLRHPARSHCCPLPSGIEHGACLCETDAPLAARKSHRRGFSKAGGAGDGARSNALNDPRWAPFSELRAICRRANHR
jgi:hypothetical protein